MAKAKQTKHTSAEIKGKERAANANKGGGKDGLADRKGGKAGHAKYKCPSCGIQVRIRILKPLRRAPRHMKPCGCAGLRVRVHRRLRSAHPRE